MNARRKVRVDGREAGYASTQPPGDGARRVDDPLIAWMAVLMDTAFHVPGTWFRFGLDPVLGLVPGVGDGTGALISVALIGASVRHGVPRIVLLRMALNVILNTVIGAIPLVGDLFSAWFKSNALNYQLLQKHGGARKASTRGDWLFVGGLIGGLILVWGVMFYVTVRLLMTVWMTLAG